MQNMKNIILGIIIGAVLVVATYYFVLMYRAIAFTQADIRAVDSFLKYQIDQGLLKLPEQTQVK